MVIDAAFRVVLKGDVMIACLYVAAVAAASYLLAQWVYYAGIPVPGMSGPREYWVTLILMCVLFKLLSRSIRQYLRSIDERAEELRI